MRITPLLLTALLAACGATSTRDVAETQGLNPAIAAPRKTTLPTVNVATASGWPAGKMPVAARGLVVNEFAGGLRSSALAADPRQRRRAGGRER